MAGLIWLAGLMVLAGVFLAGLAGYVAWRHGSAAGVSLAVLLLAVAWWGFAYAAELSTTDLVTRSRWGDLKYIGVSALIPAWLTFVLQYTGRGRLVTRWLLLALLVEPLSLLALLANRGTHDLVHFYPDSAAGQELPVVGTGPLFWVHLVYANVVLLGATVIFVATMVRLSRVYRHLATVLVSAALLPWVANLLHNLEVGWFRRVDLTPFAFIVTGAVLVWGLFRERLVDLTPLARGMVVENMADPVYVLDAFGRIADANPAAARILGRPRGQLVGRALADLLPPGLAPAGPDVEDGAGRTGMELTLGIDGEQRHFDPRRQQLLDRAGTAAGELVVLRDVTERVVYESRLSDLLAERTRVASALQASLLPAELPQLPRGTVAGLYQPAGDGREIGGDFFDVFPLGPQDWGIVIGDVSGKGAEAAAITALTRYTLRTLASARQPPSRTLRQLNIRLLEESTNERYCTLVYAVARPTESGLALTVSLGGHHPPLVLRANGETEPVGRLGTALGLIDAPDLFDTDVLLAPGDLVCLFTDGLVEARDHLDLFGSERAAAVLSEHGPRSPQEIVAALAQAARSFHGEQLEDDLALLAVRVHGGDALVADPDGPHARARVTSGVRVRHSHTEGMFDDPGLRCHGHSRWTGASYAVTGPETLTRCVPWTC